MARVCFFTHCHIVCFMTFFVASSSRAAVQSPRAAGVFMIIEGGRYTFNYTSASAACGSLNVTMATTEQMEQAVQQGLETCKYGWIAEQVAAIPRVSSDRKCGQGNRGLVLWRAGAEQEFGVFCFNASDFEEPPTPSPAAPRAPMSATALTSPTQTLSPAASQDESSTATASSTETATVTLTTKPSEQTSASTVPAETTPLPRIPSTSASPPRVSSTRTFTSHPHLSTSIQTVAPETSSTSASDPPQSESPAARSTLGAALTSIIILAALTAAGSVCYHKQNFFMFWSSRRHKDSQQGPEEDDECEESDRKYSSDITLCVNPSINFKLPE